MLDERFETRDNRRFLKSSSWRHVVSIGSIALMFALILSACSDYEDMYQDAYGYLLDEAKIDYGYFVDDRDNQSYKTVKIGSQTWMAENLNYEYKVNKKVFGNYENSKHPEYGRYYTWAAAMDSAAVFTADGKGCGYGKSCSPAVEIQGVCPDGWHLPTKDEFVSLWRAVGGQSTAGINLKFRKGWENDGDGTNRYGFSALPAGGYYKQTFLNVGENAAYWSATSYDNKEAYFMDLHSSSDDANWNNHTKEEAYSVRCLKNVGATSKSSSSVVKLSSSVAKSSSSNKVLSSSSKTITSSAVVKSSSGGVKSSSSVVKSSSSVVKLSSSVAKSSSSNKVLSSSSKTVTSSAVVKSSSSVVKSSSSVAKSSSSKIVSGKCVVDAPDVVYVGDPVTWRYMPDVNSIDSADFIWSVTSELETELASGKLSGSGLPEIVVRFTKKGMKLGPVLTFGGKVIECENLIVNERVEGISSASVVKSSSSLARYSSSVVPEGHCAVSKSKVVVGDTVEWYVAGPDGEVLSANHNWSDIGAGGTLVSGQKQGYGSTKIVVTYSSPGLISPMVQFGNQVIGCYDNGYPLLIVEVPK